MALANVNESDEDGQQVSEEETGKPSEPQIPHGILDDLPLHPVLSLQGAFQESIIESIHGVHAPVSPVDENADRRRQKMLDSNEYSDSWNSRWRQSESARFHPLLKLMAQIVFGLHLLQQQQAKSNEDVVRILHTHVNEIDAFLQQTAEDFDLAIKDIEERIRFLKLPMEHLEVFEVMLEEKKFRTQLLGGNDKIQKVMDRTTEAMEGAMLDVYKALEATKELGRYLDSVEMHWPRDVPGVVEVVEVMRGNEQGWKRYMKDLQSTGNTLSSRMVQLSSQMNQMSKLAAQAARRSKKNSRIVPDGTKSAPTSPGLRSKFFQDTTPPPMPTDSRMASPALLKSQLQDISQNPVPKLQPAPSSRSFDHSRSVPQSPESFSTRSSKSAGLPTRPKTSDSKAQKPRDARVSDSRSDTAELADFLKQSRSHVSPLQSNPPDTLSVRSAASSAGDSRKLFRSRSHGVEEAVTPLAHAKASSSLPRSATHGSFEPYSHSKNSSILSNPSSVGRTTVDSPALTSIPEKNSQLQNMPSNGFTRRLSKRMKHIQPNPLATITPKGKPFDHHPHPMPQAPHIPPSDTARTLKHSHSSSALAKPHSRLDDNWGKGKDTPPPLPTSNSGSVTSKVARPVQPQTTIFSQHTRRDTPDSLGLPSLPKSGSRSGSALKVLQPGGGSIAETSASRRYRSLKKIFHRRDEVGSVGA